jgi:hypothetical protein
MLGNQSYDESASLRNHVPECFVQIQNMKLERREQRSSQNEKGAIAAQCMMVNM